MAANTNQRLAVLIDADNAQASVIQELLAEVSRYGTATIKRAYGDWTTSNLKGWKEVLHTMAIQPLQQFSYTSGKNATDSALTAIRNGCGTTRTFWPAPSTIRATCPSATIGSLV